MRSLPALAAAVLLVTAALLILLLELEVGAQSRAASADGEESPAFATGTLPIDGVRPTALALGPDGRLYVAYDGPGAQPVLSDMTVAALTLDPATKAVLDVEVIAQGLNHVLGLALDPLAPPEAPVLYSSRQDKSATDGFEGVVSRFAAPDWAREDVITGLPSSAPFTNHFTNGLAFDDAGRLFMAQGSSTDSGLADPYFPETPLSAAVLYAGVHAPDFDGAITYDPPGPPEDDNVVQVSGDVHVFAPGTRNPYGLALHSNGHIYATDNGPTGPGTWLSCETMDASHQVSRADELNLIEEGNYYGFPNRNRGINLPDPRQCVYRAPEETPGPEDDFTAPVAVLPSHCSCNGIDEYASDALRGTMLGDLVYVEWTFGRVSRAELSEDGREVLSIEAVSSGLSQPLDIVVGEDGTMYVAEFGGGQITYLAPDSLAGDANCDGVVNSIDAAIILQFAAGLIEAVGCPKSADVNGDSLVNAVDAVLVLQYIAGLIPSLDI